MAINLTPNKKMNFPGVERWDLDIVRTQESNECCGDIYHRTINQYWTLSATVSDEIFTRIVEVLTKAGAAPPLSPEPSNFGCFESMFVRCEEDRLMVDFTFRGYQLPPPLAKLDDIQLLGARKVLQLPPALER
jgi:hypothetical protein